MATKVYGPTDIKQSALELIGNTPLVALDRLWPGPGRILAKCEFMNPGASLKDRSALSMLKRAIDSGKLKPGDPIIEVTSGNQGCGLALVAAVLGHPITLTMSAGNSPQRTQMMKAYGANVVLAPQVEGKPGNVTLADVTAAEKLGLDLVAKTGAYYVDQFNNEDNCRAHEESTGPEIWRQTGGHIDAFLATVGTAGSFDGISRYLKKQNKDIVCVAVEPEGAQVIKGESVTKALHLLQGSGYGRVQKLFKFDVLDMTLGVSDEEAVKYKNLLAEKEGLYAGYTSGANVAAAVKLLQSKRLPEDAWVVIMLCDSGLKYT